MISSVLADFTKQIYGMEKKCYQIVKDSYGDAEAVSFPIDIQKIMTFLNIRLERAPLNYGVGDKIDQNIAQLRLEEGDMDVIKTIILDNEMNGGVYETDNNLSDLERYAIAHEIGKTIIGEEKYERKLSNRDIVEMNLFSVPYSLPRLSAQLENFMYEMCGIFLLLPIEEFLDEFLIYIEDIKEHPVLMDRWIRHLSKKSEIPNYQLVNGYQYIKLCAYQYYIENLEDIRAEDEDKRKRLENLRKLFQ